MTPATGLGDLVLEAARWAQVKARVFRRNRRIWQAGRAPITRITDAKVGDFVRLSGRVEVDGLPLLSPFTGTPCVFWEARLNDLDEDALDVRAADAWERAAATHRSFHETTTNAFFITDESGRARVEPTRALTRMKLQDVSQHPHVNDDNPVLRAFLTARGIATTGFMGALNLFQEACVVPGATISVVGIFADAPSIEADGYRDRAARLLRLTGTAEAPVILLFEPP